MTAERKKKGNKETTLAAESPTTEQSGATQCGSPPTSIAVKSVNYSKITDAHNNNPRPTGIG